LPDPSRTPPERVVTARIKKDQIDPLFGFHLGKHLRDVDAGALEDGGAFGLQVSTVDSRVDWNQPVVAVELDAVAGVENRCPPCPACGRTIFSSIPRSFAEDAVDRPKPCVRFVAVAFAGLVIDVAHRPAPAECGAVLAEFRLGTKLGRSRGISEASCTENSYAPRAAGKCSTDYERELNGSPIFSLVSNVEQQHSALLAIFKVPFLL
jgi:hypothetical protein